MLVAQLTDPHICRGGELAFGDVDTLGFLRRAVRKLNDLAVDLVLVTGDLVERGEAEEYPVVRAELDRLRAPYLPLPGNHDGPDFWPVFADRLPEAEPGLGAVHQTGGVRIVLLDSSVPGEPGGAVSPEREEWLRGVLEPGAILAMHHPPIETGIARMDAIGLAGVERLAGVLEGATPRVILCGHLHRSIHGTLRGVPVRVAPSCAHAVAFDLDPDAPLRIVMDPPAVLVHRIAGDGVVSHTVFVPPDGPGA